MRGVPKAAQKMSDPVFQEDVEVVQFTCNVYKVLEGSIEIDGRAPCKYYAADSAEEIVEFYRAGFATSTWPEHQVTEFMAELKIANLTLAELLETVLRDEDFKPYRLAEAWLPALSSREFPAYLGMSFVLLERASI